MKKSENKNKVKNKSKIEKSLSEIEIKRRNNVTK